MNKKNIVNQILKAINTYPTDIALMRIERIGDGEGNYEDKPITVATFKGFIDNSGSTLSITLGDKGKIERISKIALIATFDESFEIKAGDFFEAKNIKYSIVNPVNHFDVCWICELKVIRDE